MLFFAVLGVLGSVVAGSEVVDLTDEGFEGFIKEHETTMVEFFAPWCGHCKNLAPEYDSAAETLKEHGVTIAKMDATAQTQTPAKFDVNGYPTIKVFTKGEASDYSGERTADAIVNFMRAASDPDYVPPPVAPDAGWEGNKGNVIHLTGDTVEDLREQHPKMFTMFYAPWCGHCKQLKPDWAKVSEQLTPIFADEIEGDDAVVMAAADCTAGGSEICGKYEVNGYPTLMYFGDSHAEPEKYEGPRTAKALKKFAVRKVAPDWKEPPVGEFVNEPVWEDEDYGNGEVVHLTDDHFDSYRAEHPHLFTMFYAPWCGHCKTLKPEYVEASSQAPRSFTFAAVDCTVHTDTCNAVGTSGYPTLRYFEPLVEGSDLEAKQPAGENYAQMNRAADDLLWFARDRMEKTARAQAKNVDKDTDFSKMKMKALKLLLKERGVKCEGCTDKSDFVKMVQDSIDMPVLSKKKSGGRTLMEEKRYKEQLAAAEKGWSEDDHGNGKVVHLLDDNFQEYRKANAPMFVMFYAPWCGHCKALKPDYVELSEDEELGASLAAVDCTVMVTTCQKYGVSSYPTLKWFPSKDSDKGESYEGGRTAADIAEFIKGGDADGGDDVEIDKDEL